MSRPKHETAALGQQTCETEALQGLRCVTRRVLKVRRREACSATVPIIDAKACDVHQHNKVRVILSLRSYGPQNREQWQRLDRLHHPVRFDAEGQSIESRLAPGWRQNASALCCRKEARTSAPSSPASRDNSAHGQDRAATRSTSGSDRSALSA